MTRAPPFALSLKQPLYSHEQEEGLGDCVGDLEIDAAGVWVLEREYEVDCVGVAGIPERLTARMQLLL